MVDLNRVLKGLTQSGVASGLAGGLAGGALTGALTSKKGRKTAATLLKVGGIAAVGGLAWKAYQNYQQRPVGAGPRSAPKYAAAEPDWQRLDRDRFEALGAKRPDSLSDGMLIIRAMIAAATADGHMDGDEQSRIFAEAERLELGASDKALLFDELRNPAGLDDLVSQIDRPELAVEVYAASVLAIDETLPAGRAYLELLAERLNLPEELVRSVHAEIDRGKVSEHAA